MRQILLSACLLLTFAAPAAIAAQSPPPASQLLNKIPQNILDGLDALRHDQPDQVESSWKKGALANLDGISFSLRNTKDELGEYHGFDLVSLQDISPRIRVIYIALNYERGPQFKKFVTYRNSTGWVVLEPIINLNTADMASVLAARPTN
ncbi:hypothetical protein [Terracidiphilus gabretensis]|jgi:hypothetical protein|uniref:hypothetical protein n=1 Tax=Terracidiphilus gabretensis TaxID=1577687 RepID=UPI00071B4306|nr:hypothetical protein [Terracidiphilus gabretensis]